MRLGAAWGVLLLWTSPASAQEVWRDELQVAEEGTNIPLRETLPNGIKIAVQADPHAAVVVVTTRVRVGWALDPPGLDQLAHIVEHAMFRPAEGEEEGFIEAVARLGGHANAYTDPDQTVFTTIAPARHLTTVLELEPRRFQRGLRGVALGDLATERQVVRQEALQKAPYHLPQQRSTRPPRESRPASCSSSVPTTAAWKLCPTSALSVEIRRTPGAGSRPCGASPPKAPPPPPRD